MPWDCRARTKHRYYTRTVHRDGKRIRQYIGRGPKAEAAAQQDAERKAHREAGFATARQEKARLTATESPLLTLSAGLDLLAKAVLLTSGYYFADRRWKRRHERKQDTQ